MGITIREIVEEIGGGIDGRAAASRPCRSAARPAAACRRSLADTPIDYEALRQTGAIMGSGGLVVLDDRDCMVDIARFFLSSPRTSRAASAPSAASGRSACSRSSTGCARARAGRGDLEELAELADRVTRTSLCGLGQTAPNPVLTTLRYFRDEYEAHLRGDAVRPASARR